MTKADPQGKLLQRPFWNCFWTSGAGLASIFVGEKGKERHDGGKVRGTDRRQLMTEMTEDRERTGRGGGGSGLEAGHTGSGGKDVKISTTH